MPYLSRLPRTLSLRCFGTLLTLALFIVTLTSCLDDAPETPSSSSSVPQATRATTRPSGAATVAKADWTILVYLDGDNDLESSAIDDFAEMASVGSNDRMNIIVQFDRISSSEDWDDTSNGNWTGVKRFRVEKNMRPTKSNQLADLGERNMGDPRTLQDFVTWGIKTYPARRYGLIFWDHGASWPGVANDDSSDSDMLTLPELGQALGAAEKSTGVAKLDLIGFDACLMGQIDVLQSVAPYGQVAVGSADLEPGEGWAWNTWLADLARDPSKDGAAIAPSIIKSFTTFYKQQDDPSVTLAAFDLNKVALVTERLDALAGAMLDHMPEVYKSIGQARVYASEYAEGDKDISAIDLGYFANGLIKAGAKGDVAVAARELYQAIKEARISQGHGADHPNTSGVSVYFPSKKRNYDTQYAKISPLTAETRWDEFLAAFYKGGRGQPSRSYASKPQLSDDTASVAEPLRLNAKITGNDTAYVYYFIGAADPSDPNKLQVLTLDYIYPPGATPDGDAPAWKDGDEVRLTWKSSVWYVSNGVQTTRVPFTANDYGSSSYTVDGTYTTKKTGKQIPVTLEFEVSQGQGTLKHVWAFDKAGGDNPRPRELKPRSGDTFTPDVPTLATDDSGSEDATIPGEPITFGSQPLVALQGAAPNGSYVIGLLVENVSGAIDDQYAEVLVNNDDAATPQPVPAAAPTARPGSVAGMLAYHNEQLGFGLDHPEHWQPSQPGSDKVVFYDPEQTDQTYVSVDVFALDGGLTAANKATIEALLDVDRDKQDFAVRADTVGVRLAGHIGQKVEYVYRNDDGMLLHVIGIAVSDTKARATYLLTYEAPDEGFDSGKATFTQIVQSFVIDS